MTCRNGPDFFEYHQTIKDQVVIYAKACRGRSKAIFVMQRVACRSTASFVDTQEGHKYREISAKSLLKPPCAGLKLL